MDDDTRTFEAETIERAMRMVHKAFGPGACILRTRYTRSGGILGIGARDVVRITASSRRPAGTPPGPDAARGERKAADQPTPDENASAGGQAASLVQSRYRRASDASSDDDIHAELCSIRRALRTLQQSTGAAGAGAVLRENLLRAGFCDDDVDLISRKVVDHATIAELRNPSLLSKRAVDVLKPLIKVQPGLEPGSNGPRIYAVVGPTGSGKTTTLAKLAAVYKLKRGMNVSIASIDNFRVGAAEQIRRFASMIDAPLKFVSNVSEAGEVRQSFASSDIILVDTTGRSPQDGLSLSEMALLLKELGPDEVFLVTESGILGERAGRIITAFGKLLPVSRVVISKIDEVPFIGGGVSVSMRLNAPVAYLTNGQNVPDDIRSAGINSLSRLLSECL